MRKVYIGISFIMGLFLSSALFHALIVPAFGADPQIFFADLPAFDRDLAKPAAVIPVADSLDAMARTRPRRETREERFFASANWEEVDGCRQINVWVDATLAANGNYLSVQRNTYDYCLQQNLLTDYGYISPYTRGNVAIEIDRRLQRAEVEGVVPVTSCDQNGLCQNKQVQVHLVLARSGRRPGSWTSRTQTREPDGSRSFSSNHNNYFEGRIETVSVNDGAESFIPIVDPKIQARIGRERYTSRQR